MTGLPATTRRARGQALTEFLVATGALIAFWVGTMLLGRYHDVQFTAIQASRYAAFRRAAQPAATSAALIEAETRTRFFAPAPVPLRSADAGEVGSRWARETPLWLDPSGQRRLIATPQDVRVTIDEQDSPGMAGQAQRGIIGALRAASIGGAGRTDFAARGFVAGRIAVNVADLTVAASQPDARLLLREHTALLADSWHAADPAHTAERVASLTTGAWLRELRRLLRPVRAAAELLEPGFARFCPGRIDPEVVPPDRLVYDVTAARGSWTAPC